jgi:hypothetical protein
VPEAAAATRAAVDFRLSKPLTLAALDEAIGRAGPALGVGRRYRAHGGRQPRGGPPR